MTINEIACPCCKEVLYRTGPVDPTGQVTGIVKGSPQMGSDQYGYYMRCPHCSGRVVFESAPSVVGVGFKLADVQPCSGSTTWRAVPV